MEFFILKKGQIRKKVLYFGSTSQCNAKHFGNIRCRPPWILKTKLPMALQNWCPSYYNSVLYHFGNIRCRPPWILKTKLPMALQNWCPSYYNSVLYLIWLSESRMLSLWWLTHQISNSTCGRALSCFGIGWQILRTDFSWFFLIQK